MKDLLKDLEIEVSTLTTKHLGPIGFDYRRRTKIERMLYLVAKEFCAEKLDYSLKGLGKSHLCTFLENTSEQRGKENEIEFIRGIFEISEIICDISGSDPYLQEQRLEELGGSISRMLANISKRVMTLINSYAFVNQKDTERHS
ncbi:MAG: hypothetical protein CEE38_12140 [Planctomycetes bacterium B3_Pla]|nr:MAG: hypothetical protein CEE38_12140 [Planctomycetes bacterium B3_Pla]